MYGQDRRRVTEPVIPEACKTLRAELRSRGTELAARRFSTDTALQILEREALYRAGRPTPAGVFIYQFETLSRNRLGYGEGLTAMAGDPLYDADWRAFLEQVRHHVGTYDFADMVYVRSELYVTEQRRRDPGYEPPVRPLFGEKEGKIARANRGRDPLFLFAALQRQLGYPEVPRPRQRARSRRRPPRGPRPRPLRRRSRAGCRGR